MVVAASSLSELVAKFRQWLAATYTAEEIAQMQVDDAGYPHWKEIADYVTALLAADGVAALTDDEQTDLLYLVARNWDMGWLIAWLSPGEQLANVGGLKQADFLRLAAKAATLVHKEFDDAKYQFVVACQKFSALTPELERVLLALYCDANDYTKTCALASLAQLRYPAIKELAQQCWGLVSDEHAQLACLLVLAEHEQDDALLAKYLALASALPGAYLAATVAKLQQERSTGQS